MKTLKVLLVLATLLLTIQAVFGSEFVKIEKLVQGDGSVIEKVIEDETDHPAKSRTLCPNNCSGHGTCNTNNGNCTCNSGWRGDDCSFEITILSSGVTSPTAIVLQRQWHFYVLTVGSTTGMVVAVNCTSGGDADLYVRRGDYPTRTQFSYRDISTADNFQINIDTAEAGAWYFGVYGYLETQFTITARTSSECPNLGNCNPPHGSCVGPDVCQCLSGWAGDGCQYQVQSLIAGTPLTSQSVASSQWLYYSFQITSGDLMRMIINQTSTTGDADLYMKFNALPSFYNYDYRDITLASNFEIDVNSPSLGTWYVGVYGFSAATFTITLQVGSECPSKCSLHGQCHGSSCTCNSGYSGSFCETKTANIVLGTSYSGYVNDNSWNYYTVQATTNNDVVLGFSTSPSTPSGDCDVYVKRGQNPTRTSFDYRDIGFARTFNVTIDDPADYTWYIGVYGYTKCEYAFNATITTPNTNTSFSYPVLRNGDIGRRNEQVSVPAGWSYYQFLAVNTTYVAIDLRENNSAGFLWVFVSKGRTPDTRNYDYSDQNTNSKFHRIAITFSTPQTDTWIVGVYANPFAQCTGCTSLGYAITAWNPPF